MGVDTPPPAAYQAPLPHKILTEVIEREGVSPGDRLEVTLLANAVEVVKDGRVLISLPKGTQVGGPGKTATYYVMGANSQFVILADSWSTPARGPHSSSRICHIDYYAMHSAMKLKQDRRPGGASTW